MSQISFVHFDTSLRSDLTDDPFHCSLVIANPIRNIKKIYLKSCEIPLGFFNIRVASQFVFTMFHRDMAEPMKYGDITFTPVFNEIELLSKPRAQNSYFNKDFEPIRTVKPWTPLTNETNIYCFPLTYKITIPPGNYAIESLIEYINEEIKQLNKLLNDMKVNRNLDDLAVYLTTLTLNDTGMFPVGYVRLFCGITNLSTQIISTNYLTNTILGFDPIQQNSINTKHITAPRLWGLYSDLAIYLYFPNVPHNNTHFAMQLLSFKIPMNAGYQAIAFSADSQNFSQYIELSDTNFILNNLKIDVFDTQGNALQNQYNFGFTLGFETV